MIARSTLIVKAKIQRGRVITLPVKTPCFSLRDVDGELKSLFVKKRFDNCEKMWYHIPNTLDTALTLHACAGGVRFLFYPFWIEAGGDSQDLVSLICPRDFSPKGNRLLVER